MKIYILCIFLLSGTISLAQYTELLRSGTAWNERTHQFGMHTCYSYGPFYNGKQLFVEGDTLIGSTTFKKVKSYVMIEGSTPVSQTPCFYFEINQTNSTIEALLFEDVQTQQVFIYNEQNDTMTLLYDFSLDTGDTLWRADMGDVIITNVDSINVNGDWRKQLFTDAGEPFIEGIGGANGLLSELYTPVSGYLPYICVWNNGVNEYGGCNFYLGKEELSDPYVKTKCGLRKIWITLVQPETLQIFSADGKFVYGEKLPSGESIFDLEFLERGAYILRIGDSFSEKFIKQ